MRLSSGLAIMSAVLSPLLSRAGARCAPTSAVAARAQRFECVSSAAAGVRFRLGARHVASRGGATVPGSTSLSLSVTSRVGGSGVAASTGGSIGREGQRAFAAAAGKARGGGGKKRAGGGGGGGGARKKKADATGNNPRPGRKGVGPPARRGAKKKKAATEALLRKTAAVGQPGRDDPLDEPSLEEMDVDDELSAFNDDDAGWSPRVVTGRGNNREMEMDDDDDFRDEPSFAAGDSFDDGDFDENDDGDFEFLDDDEGDFEAGKVSAEEMVRLAVDEADAVFMAEADAEDDDDLYLTDAEDSLTQNTQTQAKGANVKSCRYVQSCVKVKDCPPPRYPEIAVIGRSNVGKSSLINMLTNRKGVAKTSKNPGKTQTINHFEMVTGDGTWYLVDLPGYGFANAPESARQRWALFTREYLLERENLLSVMLLIDSTVKPQRLDLECLEFLGENNIPVTIVFTKVDKKRKVKAGKRARPEENVEEFCREVSEYWEEMPPMIFTSSKTGDGKQSVLNHVATLRQYFKEGDK